MKWFYFESDRGCGIREYRNHETALKGIARECGDGYVTVVRDATERDISWVRGMGGYIPERRPTKRAPDAGKRAAKKRVSKSRTSTVKKVGTRPAQRR